MNKLLARRPPVGRLAYPGFLALGLVATAALQAPGPAPDPLPSWQEGATKAAIIAFVERVTTEGNAGFIPREERIAVFDNDGTLWVEKPLPVEVYFSLARLRELADRDPSIATREPFRAALAGDAAYFHEAGPKAIAELLAATHSGMTQDAFAQDVRRFLATARHPTLNRPYTTLVYQPMLELLAYLEAEGFQTWISSGGTIDFIRVFAPATYRIPPERTIGSELRRESRRSDDRLDIYRLGEVEHLNDKDGKPVGIDRQIGRRPVFVGGNVLSGGDIAMMEFSRSRSGPSFQLLVVHDDPDREFAYTEANSVSLRAAARLGFITASVQRDWRRIFSWE